MKIAKILGRHLKTNFQGTLKYYCSKFKGQIYNCLKSKGKTCLKNKSFFSIIINQTVVIKYFVMAEILSAGKRKFLKAQSFSLKYTIIVIIYNDM